MKQCLTFVMVFLIMGFTLPAHAQEIITEAQLKSFLASMKEVKDLSNDMKQKGKGDMIKKNVDVVQQGGISAYSSAVKVIQKEFPDHFRRLNNTVKRFGFSSVSHWASTGDTLVMAHMSNKVIPADGTSLTGIEKVTPEMIKTMSPKAKERIANTKAMVKMLRNVPDENKRLARQYQGQIEQAMRSM